MSGAPSPAVPTFARTLLVPLDGTSQGERALPSAVALATAIGAGIELVTVTWHDPPTAEESYLKDVASQIAGVPVQVRTVPGLPGPALRDLLDRTADTAVCMATRGHGGAPAVLLGSVGDELLRDPGPPFVLVGPHVEPPSTFPDSGPVVLCFDGSDAATSIVPDACALAAVLGGEVRVTMVLHHYGDYLGNQLATTAKQRANDLVDELIGQGFTARLELLDSLEPGHAIVKFARDLSSPLVVAGSHGSRGVVRGLIGSTAARIVHHAPCPVLVRHPAVPTTS
jgi:nucleotide-binding universal stress UspA family protein